MNQFGYTILIPAIPLAMFLFLGLAGTKFKPLFSGIAGSIGLLIVTILSYFTAWAYFFHTPGEVTEFAAIIPWQTTWLAFTETLIIRMGILLDPISVMMLVVISTVSLMVNIYSIGYMKGEKGFERYFAFLSLFTFSMLGLVLATNIFQMYIFWELVGVSSYLLIGFYYEKPSAVAASKKAFIVTRFADLGFLIGILLISVFTGTFDFSALTDPSGAAFSSVQGLSFMGMSVISWALLLVFMGGAGKSAMFPLHIWLPDAMEGPTPVSALIHAATMVVAGVYLVARMFVVYHLYALDILEVIAWVGGITSVFAAIIACTQFDIKRVLAFSTLSQIGYMILALGVSGYEGEHGVGYMASMFHLFTHAMFKALLFLGAGSLIHAVHSNSINDMGQLRKYMPITHITFLIACLTIAGIPPLSGFFSKDEILVAVYNHNKALFVMAYLVAGLTAFYMFRIYFRAFWGPEKEYHHKPHESSLVMTFPLMFLAFASIFAGFIPFSKLVTATHQPFEAEMHYNIAGAAIAISLIGIILSTRLFRRTSSLPLKVTGKLGVVYTTIYNKFYIDEIYLFITKKIIFNSISRPVAWFDRHIVDGTMNGIAWCIDMSSIRIRKLQSGQIQHYAFVFVSGVIVLSLIIIYLVQ
jgi:NADH-quinone oxidoreductase subunit L